jgi:hypothetical protein
VPDVQEVETPVGEDDARAPFARNRHARNQTVALKYARGRVGLLLFVARRHLE